MPLLAVHTRMHISHEAHGGACPNCHMPLLQPSSRMGVVWFIASVELTVLEMTAAVAIHRPHVATGPSWQREAVHDMKASSNQGSGAMLARRPLPRAAARSCLASRTMGLQS